MATSITPVVYRERRMLRWGIAAQLHIAGAGIGGAFTGLLLSFASRWLHASRDDHWPLALAILSVAALGYGLAELQFLRLPRPQIARQVPKYWRGRFHPWITATLYGMGLGSGVTTRIVTGLLYIILVAVVAAAEPLYGMVIFGLFGLSRGTSAMILGWLAHRADSGEQPSLAMKRYIGQQDFTRFIAGIALAAAGGYWSVSVLLLLH